MAFGGFHEKSVRYPLNSVIHTSDRADVCDARDFPCDAQFRVVTHTVGSIECPLSTPNGLFESNGLLIESRKISIWVFIWQDRSSLSIETKFGVALQAT